MPGLLLSAASIASAAPGDAEGTGASQQCKVTIDRSATGYDVTKQVFEDGNCICYAYTGPKPQADSIEGAISALLNTKQCPDAKVQQISGPSTGPVGGTGAGGGIGTVAPIVAGGAAAAALAATGGGGSPSSP
jgi:hypothetical protein